MGHLAPGEIFENMLQLKRFVLYFEGILNKKWLLSHSGVVGNFLLWERSHSIMVTYPIVIRGGGGGGVVPELIYKCFSTNVKGKNPCSKMGV